jgi:hypothetical protein
VPWIRWRRVARKLVLVAVGVLLAFPAAGVAARPLQTAFIDPFAFGGPDAETAFTRAEDAGTSAVRLQLVWLSAAPMKRPKGFDPKDPADPAYQFAFLDGQVRLAAEHGLEPIVYIEAAPKWALVRSHGFLRPDPKAFGAFALAAARRYSGHFEGLPRVRFWQAWNEPNKLGGPEQKASQPDWYRDVVVQFAAAVHRVHGDNAVVAGGLAPFGQSTVDAPLDFMRRLLCMSKGPKRKPACSLTTPFEIWSTHPYTSGGPTRKADRQDDVSLGNLPEMKALLDAAVRAHHVRSRQPVRFWVTEFSWDTRPPDPKGVPIKLHARWVSEALYRMWAAGVSLCVWFRLDDDPLGVTPYQSGLYFHAASLRAERPKLTLQAFRFPFVALPKGNRILVWGRTPGGERGTVVVEQRSGSVWRRLAAPVADRYGIFSLLATGHGAGALRARRVDGTATSLPFALKSPPDRFVDPFGE